MRCRRGIIATLIISWMLWAVLATKASAMRAEEGMPDPVMDNMIHYMLLFDQLEYSANDGPDTFEWDAQGWVGTDYNRLWIKTEGEQQLSDEHEGEVEVQMLYSRLISPYFDMQAGVRHDQFYGSGDDRHRSFGVLGLEGLAIHWFEVELALFVSEDGDLSARLTGEYDLPITQRLILQPKLETELAIQEVEEFGVGQGLNYIELGARLRYEIRREFAPYLGVSWNRQIGETAGLARREGEDDSSLSLVAGVRMWF